MGNQSRVLRSVAFFLVVSLFWTEVPWSSFKLLSLEEHVNGSSSIRSKYVSSLKIEMSSNCDDFSSLSALISDSFSLRLTSLIARPE